MVKIRFPGAILWQNLNVYIYFINCSQKNYFINREGGIFLAGFLIWCNGKVDALSQFSNIKVQLCFFIGWGCRRSNFVLWPGISGWPLRVSLLSGATFFIGWGCRRSNFVLWPGISGWPLRVSLLSGATFCQDTLPCFPSGSCGSIVISMIVFCP